MQRKTERREEERWPLCGKNESGGRSFMSKHTVGIRWQGTRKKVFPCCAASCEEDVEPLADP